MWAIDYKIGQTLANFEIFPSFFVVVAVVFFFHVNLCAKEPAILVGQEPKQLCQQ